MYQSRIMRAIDLWLNSSLTLSCTVLFNVAFHQLSKTTSSVGYLRPSDLIFRLLSGLKMDIDLPGPQSNSMVSLIGKIVPWSVSNVSAFQHAV